MSIKKIFALIALIMLFQCHGLKAQTLKVNNTASAILSGSVDLNFNNAGSITNNGVLDGVGSNSTVTYSCNCNASLGGSATSSFNNFTFNVSSLLTLNGNIMVDGDLKFATNGLFELNNFDIDLGNGSGKLVGETNNARITGINGGRILKTQILNGPSDVNPGNLGMEITTSQNLGATQIIRGHVQQNNAGNPFSGVYRYFDFLPSTGNTTGMNITARLNYFDDELISGFNKTDLTLWNSPDFGTSWLMNGDDSKSTTSDWVEKTSINFINYRLTLSNTVLAPLPVRVLYFKGKMQDGYSNLYWSIVNDGSLNHFELERSSDALSFTKLSDILPTLSTVSVEDYAFVDQHPFNPVTFYRLKVIDKTQKYFYSNVVKLKSGTEITATIYPNPATGHTYLSFSSVTNGNTTVELFNSAGQLVKSRSISYNKGDNVFEISLADLPKGMYVIRSMAISFDHNVLIRD